MAPQNFNHIVLSQQAVFGSCTTPILSDGAITPQKIGTLALVVIQDITYTAASGGTSGNNITITYVEDVLPGQEMVTVSGNSITVHIGNSDINVTNVLDSTHLELASTAEINIGDTITQGIHSTTVVLVVSATELQVTSTVGFVTGAATDNGLLSTATQVLAAVQNSYLASTLVTAMISGIPSNKQIGTGSISLSGGQHSVVVSGVQADSNPLITGNVKFISGTSITLVESGNSITINASGAAAGVTSLNSLTGALTLAAGSNITITPSGGNTLTIASSLTFGNLTDAGTDGITITGGTGAVIGSGTTISQHVADSTHNGYLASSDWSTFNNKQPAGSYITALTGDVTASGPGSSVATVASTAAVKTIHADASSNLTGNVQLVSGTNVTLSQIGQVITINSTGGLSAANFVVGEDLTSQITGSTVVFTLTFTPVVNTEDIFLNGARLRKGVSNDYTISGAMITLAYSPALGDNLVADYIK